MEAHLKVQADIYLCEVVTGELPKNCKYLDFSTKNTTNDLRFFLKIYNSFSSNFLYKFKGVSTR
jgi:hypothetical protein